MLKRCSPVILILASCGGGEPVTPARKNESVVEPYVAIQETLARDSLDQLSELSARVVVAAEPVQREAGIGDMSAGAGRVAAKDIDTARVGFQKMSMGLITYLKAHTELRAGYEVVFCPMAFNNKGAYWVQKTGEIVNPYHGMMMLHCGDKVAWDKAPG